MSSRNRILAAASFTALAAAFLFAIGANTGLFSSTRGQANPAGTAPAPAEASPGGEAPAGVIVASDEAAGLPQADPYLEGDDQDEYEAWEAHDDEDDEWDEHEHGDDDDHDDDDDDEDD